MSQKSTMYLTVQEQMLFRDLPLQLRALWEKEIRSETIDAYEDPAELRKRLADVSDLDSKVVAFLSSVKQKEDSGKMEQISFKGFPESQLAMLLQRMGASGITVMIALALQQDVLSAVDFEGVVALSHVRHRILLKNAAASSSAAL